MVKRDFVGALVTVITVLCPHGVQTGNITVVPEEISISNGKPSSDLSITCTPEAGATRVYGMEIGKRSDSDKITIVQIKGGNTNVSVHDTSLEPRMNYSGSITGASSRLEILLSDVRCSDAATYYCATIIEMAEENPKNSEATAKVSVRTLPFNIRMVVTPDRTKYQPNTQVNFTCYGLIGNNFNMSNADTTWTWEWQYVEGANKQWTPYPNTRNIASSIPVPGNGSCQYSGSSTLVHTVTEQDNKRQFRCYVVSQEYSGEKIISLQDSPATKSPDTSGSEDTKAIDVTIWMTTLVLLVCIEI